jgi:hypothetical protein
MASIGVASDVLIRHRRMRSVATLILERAREIRKKSGRFERG